jgi:hypothetical protein
MPPNQSIQVASHYIYQSKLPCMSLGSMHACHSDRCKQVTQIHQSKLLATTTYIHPSCHACRLDRYMHATRIDASMSLGSRHVACHHINQSKLPAPKSIQVAITCMSLGSIHACHSDRCKHVTRSEACCMPPNQSKLPCMALGSIHVCHSDRGM